MFDRFIPKTTTALFAGDLRYPILVQQKKKAVFKDEYGHLNTRIDANWSDYCPRRADLKAFGAREVVGPDGEVIDAVITYQIRIRYDNLTKDIDPTMRIIADEGKIFNIETCYDPDGTKQQLLLTAVRTPIPVSSPPPPGP
jgi:head-tail adaptor